MGGRLRKVETCSVQSQAALATVRFEIPPAPDNARKGSWAGRLQQQIASYVDKK